MRIVQSLIRRLRSLFNKESSNAALSEELIFHIERQTEENIAGGMSPAHARAAARAEFGNIAQATEASYRARGVGWLEDFMQDLRYGVRTLSKDPWFSLITILTLALGIGACTAIFSLVNAVLIRSLPYGEVEKLVYLFTPYPHPGVPAEVFGPSFLDFSDLKKQSHSYADMTHFEQKTLNLAEGDRVERVGAAMVDGEFFRTLQSAPEVGRVFDASGEANDPVVVIGYGLWQTIFGGKADAIGQTLRLDGRAFSVVGVMPKGFSFPNKSDLAYGNPRIAATQLWIPLLLTQQQKTNREVEKGFVVARLRPDATRSTAQAEMSTIMSRLDLLHAADMRGWSGLVKPFRDSAFGPVRPLMLLLLGAVGFVLLIACGNAANLLLARAANRTHEFGVRATLGAQRGRLLRQMITESMILGTASGVIGVALAYVLLDLLLRLNTGDIPRMSEATLDLRVLVFLAGITLLTSLCFGVLPSLSATRVRLSEFLKSGGLRGSLGGRSRVRKCLAMIQVALVVVLLTGAGLLLRSYEKVIATPTGFSSSTLAASVQLSAQYDTDVKRTQFFRELLERMNRVPGVEAVGLVNYLPLSGSESLSSIAVQGSASGENELAEVRVATPYYLPALGISLLRGRGFAEEEGPGKPPVAIVNVAFAKKYFGGGNPTGHRLREGSSNPWTTIIGEIGDVRNISLETTAIPQIYKPLWQNPSSRTVSLAVRSSLPQERVEIEMRSAMKSLDPNIAIADVRPMQELVSQTTARRRFQTTLLTLFAAIAMLLALVGVYGLLAYSVKQRTSEIGIRIALGSTKLQVVGLVLKEGLGLLVIGLVIGMSGALAATRLLTGFLYGVPPIDPLTYTLVPLLLLIATLIACLVPSYRAAGIDPINALRHE
jgi:predicted permease